MKIKVLAVAENPLISSGFGVYGTEILKRLASNANLELACLACSGSFADPAFFDLPYKVYSAMPNPRINSEVATYNTDPHNEFGKFRFDEVCLDFKPDIVIAWRDHMNDAYLEAAAFRRFYSLILMSSCDAAPRHHGEIDTYSRLDGLITYGDFGRDTLSAQMGNFDEIYYGAAPPSADYDIFRPHFDKAGLKASLGLDGKIVIGTVNRNQPRKMFPELIEAFSLLQKAAPDSIKDKLALYLHTSYPDQGWAIPQLLLNAGIASKTYFTYTCTTCKEASASPYRGIQSLCPKCGAPTFQIASSNAGVSRETLAGVYNCFDIYTQFATCEGFGMGLPEAAACGVPGVTIDYSAMSEIAATIGAQAITPDCMRLEAGIERKLACVSPEKMCEALLKEVIKPSPLREFEGGKAAKRVREAYNYDKSAAVWQNAIYEVFNKSERDNWGAPARIISEQLGDFHSQFQLAKYMAGAMNPESRKVNHKLLSRFMDSLSAGGDLAKREIWGQCLDKIMKYNRLERERMKRCILL